ncbi:MAG TPA: FHA domain-containing protein [Gaiellaceae bacterium]|nr:FHA domain-containing protein [Gaiellaceae bacterium]
MPDYLLEIVEGPEAGRRIPLAGPIELGRDPSADGPLLQDELVSRRHVRLTPEDDGARVEDLESRNGTFVDGDEIYGPAHLGVDGQLLIGVTVLQLRPATAEGGPSAVTPIPAGLTALRPLPSEPPAVTAVRQVPTLALEESEPTYVPPEALAGKEGKDADTSGLLALLDSHTKSKARGAPIGLFVLAALAVILYLSLR